MEEPQGKMAVAVQRLLNILILGVAYKADVGDMRESPALDLIYLLRDKGSNLTYHDPYIPHLTVDGLEMESVSLDQEALEAADCVVIIAAHSSYDWNWVVNSSRLVIDTRNATKNVAVYSAQIEKL